VSTIFFCYLTFPSLLPYLQECSRSTQQQWIWGACILPMVIVPLLARVITDSSGLAMDEVIWMIYKHPLYRFPQFVLGVLGGLLRKVGPSLLGAEVAPSSISDWSESHTG
jgi:peptidoglycan/LPS O-acetylase OafA/YrhL